MEIEHIMLGIIFISTSLLKDKQPEVTFFPCFHLGEFLT